MSFGEGFSVHNLVTWPPFAPCMRDILVCFTRQGDVSCRFFFSCLKCIFTFIFSADDEQMVIAFSALYIGDFCVARWGLLLQVMVSFS